MSESFSTLFQESLKTIDLMPGKTITGVVMSVDKDWVTVHAGLKSEGIIPTSQFLLDPDSSEPPKVGDEVAVMLETIDDGLGNTCLSREKALRAEAWQKLEEAFNSETDIAGIVSTKVKGGYMVDVGLIRCFLPGSLVDERPVPDTVQLEGQTMDFRIIRLERNRSNVVLSRRAVIENHTNAEREALLASLMEGQTVTGIVKNLTDYGAFVDIGGVDGLLHVTDMSWKRISSPQEVVAIGDEITASVVRYDKETQRISLGLKQLSDNPWDDIKEKYVPGSQWTTRVINLTDYGFFVELEDGIVGLIHISEMNWLNNNQRPSQVVNIGDEVKVSVLDVDTERCRISLSIKRCFPNPWEEFEKKYAVGDQLKGEISSTTDFGLFVTLESGLKGLVHTSDISWNEAEDSDPDKLQKYKKGDQVDVVLLSVEPKRERISLSIRQADDPLQTFIEQHPVGSRVSGKVTKVLKHSATVELMADVIGLLQAAHVSSSEDIDNVRDVLSAGDSVEAVIIDVNHKLRRVYLSVKELEKIETEDALDNFKEQNQTANVKLGDLLKTDKKEEKDS